MNRTAQMKWSVCRPPLLGMFRFLGFAVPCCGNEFDTPSTKLRFMMTLARGMEVTVGIVLMSFLAAGIGWPATPPGDNEVVAKVNGIAITKDQVRQRVDIYERAHPGLAPGESRIRRAGIAAQVLIYAILTEQLARELGVSVSNDEIDAEYAKTQGRLSDG